MNATSHTALEELLVVETGARIGAATCGSVLAQLGADVIFVTPDGCPLTSHKGRHLRLMSAGKRILSPNAEPDRLARLIETADIVISSSDDGISQVRSHESRIACDITAFGASGPLAGEPWLDPQIQALTGMAQTTGLAEAPPLATSLPIVEYLAGLNATVACLAALRARRLGRGGQSLDIALYDSAVVATSSFLARIIAAEDPPPLGRIGNAHPLSAPWNAYKAQDGWVLLCTGSDEQWRRLCTVIDRPDLAEADGYRVSADRVAGMDAVDALMQAWIGARAVADCVSRLSEAGIAIGPIAPIDGYPREDNLMHRDMVRKVGDAWLPGSPFLMSRTPGRALDPAGRAAPGSDIDALIARAGNRPAHGGAKSAGGVLEGLKVIEIGHYTTAPVSARVMAALGADVIKVEPPAGEAARGWAPNLHGQSLFYTISNSDKRTVCLDLRVEEDRAHLTRLLADADVLIENLKPDALARRGFDAKTLARINPGLVTCAISGFGADSLYPGRPAFDTVVQAMSGLMDQVRSNDVPVKTGISLADVMGAAIASVAVLAALEWRDRGGTGQAIDLSMQDIVAWATAPAWNDEADQLPKFTISGDDHDGYELTLADPGPSPARVPVCLPIDMLRSAQTSARELVFEVEDERGRWPALATAINLTDTPARVRTPGPAVDRHTRDILGATHASEKISGDVIT